LLLEVTMPFFFPFKNIIINCHMQIWWRHEFSKGCSREWYTSGFLISLPFLFSKSLAYHILAFILIFPCLIQVLAFEAGRKHKIRVNTISAGILAIPS
jgi:hypothetical protein